MELKKLTKEWRIWVLGLALILSTLMLFPHYEQAENGDVRIATSLDDNLGIEFQGGTRLLLSIETNETGDAQERLAQQVREILQLRMQRYGLSDPQLRTVRIGDEYQIQVQVGGTNQSEVRNLIAREGTFEARMPIPVRDSKNFTLENTYRFDRQNGNVSVYSFQSGQNIGTYQAGDRFELDNTSFIYYNRSDNTANLEVVAYSGTDIEEVLTSQSTMQGSGPYQFRFPVVITSEAAQNVQRVSQNYQDVLLESGGSGSYYLGHENGEPAKLRLYVDGNRENALNMASVFKDQVVTQPSITGGADTQSQAREDMNRLQAILQSGSLPAPVQIESITTLSSSLGSNFMTASILSIIAALIAVGSIVFLRYRDPMVAIPIVFTGASEVYILLGMWFTTVGTLSLSAIAGIIAAVGTGVDDQIIITDESDKTTVRSWAERMSRAFFVIFTSAASTIGAMVPIISPSLSGLMIGAAGVGLAAYSLYSDKAGNHYIAIGTMAVMVAVITGQFNPSGDALATIHDFAWTTIWGILIGITITRPAFAKVIEEVKA
jgi:preprotein translocase subunit SecD